MSATFSMWRVLRTFIVITVAVVTVLAVQDSGYARLAPGPVTTLPVTGDSGQWMVLTVAADEVSRAEVFATLITRQRLVRLVPSTGDEEMDVSRQYAGAVASSMLGATTPIPYDLGVITGPSAGLTMTLATIDNALGGALSQGRRIAVTGEITATGDVRSVGGLEHKAQAARNAQVDLLIAPRNEAAILRTYLGSIPVVGVDTVQDAVDELCADMTHRVALCSNI